MPKTSLHPELEQFFATHATGTKTCKREAHDALRGLNQMADRVDEHVRLLAVQLTESELAGHDHALDPKLHWMHTRLAAAMERVGAFRAAGRDLARVLVEIEAGFDEDKRSVAIMLASMGVSSAPATVEPE